MFNPRLMNEDLLPFLTPVIYWEARLQLQLDLVLTCFFFFLPPISEGILLSAGYYCCLLDRAPAAPWVDAFIFIFLMETQTWVSLREFFRFSKTCNLLIFCEGERGWSLGTREMLCWALPWDGDCVTWARLWNACLAGWS